jgi:hypothetical protein
VLAGLGAGVGEWERTPKTGERGAGPGAASERRYAAAGRTRRAEAALALYFTGLLAWAAGAGQARALPFLAVLAAGYTWVALARSERAAGRKDGRA